MLISMAENHVQAVADIHLLSWANYEISVKLGIGYLKKFYNQIVSDSNAFGYVFVHENEVIAYAVGFDNYRKFGANFQKDHYLTLIYSVVTSFFNRKLSINAILNIFYDNAKLEFLEHQDYHLGALALKNKYMRTELGKMAVLECIGAVINHLHHAGYPSCWGCCDERNVPMQKVLENGFGFVIKGLHKQKGRNIVMFEKKYSSML